MKHRHQFRAFIAVIGMNIRVHRLKIMVVPFPAHIASIIRQFLDHCLLLIQLLSLLIIGQLGPKAPKRVLLAPFVAVEDFG